jgi:hypothetical protein
LERLDVGVNIADDRAFQDSRSMLHRPLTSGVQTVS